ncbi:drug/metabolite transporter (DMT)-like permease [Chitinivorax tropicus]|uniref:Drug/metabolite transporter (DMT)-like permease n=1 Tax=Chitinivorax tropicus TaxID=714531 RepID=A0A840MUG4_9PROT|nr:DMT family transporter [Chitinivorax tropicus]MBB5020006.1 drug/metabolite transporter (DMT)-like permease [Chitinivorax tropicus]
MLKKIDGYSWAILAAFGFSMKAIFVKLAYQTAPVSATTLLAMRMAIALPFFAWMARLGAQQKPVPLTASRLGQVVALGCLGYYLSSLFDFEGLRHITAGLERLILYLYPTMVLLIQAVLMRKPPSNRAWQAIGLCYLGLAIAFGHDLQLGSQESVWLGGAWVFASAVTYAIYYVGTGKVVGVLGPMQLTGLSGTASCLMVLAHWAITDANTQPAALPIQIWGYATAMAMFSTVLPIWALAQAIRRMGTSDAAAIGALGPALTILFAWWWLGESLSWWQMAGMGLIIIGVIRLKPAKAPADK